MQDGRPHFGRDRVRERQHRRREIECRRKPADCCFLQHHIDPDDERLLRW